MDDMKQQERAPSPKMTFRRKSELKAKLVPKRPTRDDTQVEQVLTKVYATSAASSSSHDARSNGQVNRAKHVSADKLKSDLLDDVMRQIVRLAKVHCADTADMMTKVWSAQRDLFEASNEAIVTLASTKRTLSIRVERLEEELKQFKVHANNTIAALEDRVQLLQADKQESEVNNEVLKRKLSALETEYGDVASVVKDTRKSSSIDGLSSTLESALDSIEAESRRQTHLLLELEDALAEQN